ncbi:hypothetical protein [Streptomyces chiangmaiensis]|uniref:Uncharacterized protein n=1 Tax=Streptomyces chiangmaiensis TaxID=766497 RepID=A0ABU7FBB1_9ACTN|nr:hypothetical protein [Streptomyces chiangmaiensis]MED7821475.1 hypothetical protein [Streptomyces chiangmaiensis]
MAKQHLEEPRKQHAHEGAGLHLHTRTVHPSLTIPYITRDDMTSTAKAATSWMPGMPANKDLVFYGGLGAMALAGALEWPVALAVGGATYLLRGGRAHRGGAEVQNEHNGGKRG